MNTTDPDITVDLVATKPVERPSERYRLRTEGLTPAMTAVLLRRVSYQGLDDWLPVWGDGFVIVGYVAAGGRAFVRAEQVEAERARGKR